MAYVQNAPRPMGNFVELDPQTALNTLLLTRFAEGWTVPQNRPLIMGFGVPFTANASYNAKYFTNAGCTHMERNILLDRLNVPTTKRYKLITDQDAKGLASAAANELQDSDPRKVHLLNYANNKSITTTDYTTYEVLGRKCWNSLKGAGLDLVGFDIEDFADNTPLDRQEGFQRGANLGMAKAITEQNAPTKFFQYGGSLADIISYIKNYQDSDIYMRIPGGIWRGAGDTLDINATEIGTYYRTHGAYIGRDNYARRTFDDRSVYQKNNDGSIKLDSDGNPVWYKSNFPNGTVTNYGVSSVISTYEAKYWIQMFYEQDDDIITQWRWLCNTPLNYDGNQVLGQMPYPRGPVDIRPGFDGPNGPKIIGFYRDETEAEAAYNPDGSGSTEIAPNTNSRPLNPRAIRFQMLMRGLFFHGNILWSDKGYYDFVQGQTYIHEGGGQMVTERSLAMGQWEQMFAANYQAKYFPILFDLMDANKIEFVWGKRGIYKGNRQVGEREIDKPIVHIMQETGGGLRTFGVWCYPVQDVNNAAHERDITVWIELDNGTKSGSWLLHCANRNACYDSWLRPVGFANAKPENYRFQFTNLLGQTFTWSGNYNVTVAGNPTPPAPIVYQKTILGVS